MSTLSCDEIRAIQKINSAPSSLKISLFSQNLKTFFKFFEYIKQLTSMELNQVYFIIISGNLDNFFYDFLIKFRLTFSFYR